MGRKLNSPNKYISLKIRKLYDSQLLVDKDFNEEPSQTLLRLYKSSKHLTYTISHINYTDGQTESMNINDYVRTGLKIRPSSPEFNIVFKVDRNNYALQEELKSFYAVTHDYILNNLLKDDVANSKNMIFKYISNMERIIKGGIEETKHWNDPKIQTFEFEHIFLLHSKRKKFLQMPHPDNFNSYLNANPNYFKRKRAILHSWHFFWEAHLPHITQLKELFTSQGTFKLKDGLTYQDENLKHWLEEGLDKFLQPLDPRFKEDSDKLIMYLKYIILSGQHTKPQRKKQQPPS
jgi:hypothetical protein